MEANVKFLGAAVPQWTFGDRIRKVRRDTGRTTAQMAEALDVGEKRYGAWETDRNKPDDIARIAVKLEKVTGVPREWFLGWADGPVNGGPGSPVDSSTASRHAALAQSAERFTRNDESHTFADIIPFPLAA